MNEVDLRVRNYLNRAKEVLGVRLDEGALKTPIEVIEFSNMIIEVAKMIQKQELEAVK